MRSTLPIAVGGLALLTLLLSLRVISLRSQLTAVPDPTRMVEVFRQREARLVAREANLLEREVDLQGRERSNEKSAAHLAGQRQQLAAREKREVENGDGAAKAEAEELPQCPPVDTSAVSSPRDHGFMHAGLNPSSEWVFEVEPIVRAGLSADALLKTPRRIIMGMPTSVRDKTGTTYLLKTLASLSENLTPSQREARQILVAVFLVDKSEDKRDMIVKDIEKHHADLLDLGLLRVLEIPAAFYPPLINVRHAYSDPEDRWKWRQKQCVDFGFMAAYAYNKCEYYLQLEDDITTVPGYLDAIDGYINSMKEQWVLLEFSNLGFIGKLFANSDLPRLATLFRVFFEDHPVDFLLRWFVALSGLDHTKGNLRKPTLFQHHGLYSSLKGKQQPLKDPHVAVVEKSVETKKEYVGNQPAAQITTSLTVYGSNAAKNAYESQTEITWVTNPKTGDDYTVTLSAPAKVTRVVLVSGSPLGSKGDGDIFEHAELQARFADKPEEYISLGSISSQREFTADISPTSAEVLALRILFTGDHENWLVLRQFAVYTA